MGLSGPVAKSAERRKLEGERAHRPLPPPSPVYIPGMPERPKGMTAAARKLWDGYIEQLAPMGVLRVVDGFALARFCDDEAMLQELKRSRRRLVAQMQREAKAAGEKLPRGGKLIELAMSPEGRRLEMTINTLASRIGREGVQFGLTPVSSQRLENIVVPGAIGQTAQHGGVSMDDPVEAALCG